MKSAKRLTERLVACLMVGIFVAGWARELLLPATVE